MPVIRFAEEAAELKKAQWPRCDQLAAALAAKGPPAADALESAVTSRVHHVRSAALKALFEVDKERGTALATALLKDRAYEVRETAASLLGIKLEG